MTAQASDLDAFKACFERNDSPRPREALDWQYVTNPTGKLFVDLALTPEKIAAIYATLPVFVRVGGDRRLALQSLDTLTDVDHRGKGLFVKLARSTFERASKDGAAFIYGFPNGNSAPGFFGKLEWTRLDPVPFLIRPLRARYVIERAKLAGKLGWLPDFALGLSRPPRTPRGLRLEAVDRFDERFTQLWASFSAEVGVAVERDAAYLNWRLVDKPGESYTRLAFFEGETPVAMVAFCVKEKHGGRVGYVMELLAHPTQRRAGRVLLRRAVASMVEQRADVALAWCLDHSPSAAAYRRAGFVPLPERFRPIELHFGARAFDPAQGALVGRRSAWYLSYTDSDTV